VQWSVGEVKCSAVQCSEVKCSAVQWSGVQCNAVLHVLGILDLDLDLGRGGEGRGGAGRGWDGLGWEGVCMLWSVCALVNPLLPSSLFPLPSSLFSSLSYLQPTLTLTSYIYIHI